jgi:hypothetical protein
MNKIMSLLFPRETVHFLTNSMAMSFANFHKVSYECKFLYRINYKKIFVTLNMSTVFQLAVTSSGTN